MTDLFEELENFAKREPVETGKGTSPNLLGLGSIKPKSIDGPQEEDMPLPADDATRDSPSSAVEASVPDATETK